MDDVGGGIYLSASTLGHPGMYCCIVTLHWGVTATCTVLTGESRV